MPVRLGFLESCLLRAMSVSQMCPSEEEARVFWVWQRAHYIHSNTDALATASQMAILSETPWKGGAAEAEISFPC